MGPEGNSEPVPVVLRVLNIEQIEDPLERKLMFSGISIRFRQQVLCLIRNVSRSVRGPRLDTAPGGLNEKSY